jgi:hypothetical protein
MPNLKSFRSNVSVVPVLTVFDRIGSRRIRWISSQHVTQGKISGKWLIGRILLSVVYREASRDIAQGPTRNRQKKMVKVNVENLPLLLGLVLFSLSKGNFTLKIMDACISLMNGLVFTALRVFGSCFVGLF